MSEASVLEEQMIYIAFLLPRILLVYIYIYLYVFRTHESISVSLIELHHAQCPASTLKSYASHVSFTVWSLSVMFMEDRLTEPVT